MPILIVQGRRPLAALWAQHLQRKGFEVCTAHSEDDALQAIETTTFNVVITDIVIDGQSVLSVCDMVQLRQPEARVIFATASTFFSDGSIFNLYPNACAHLHRDSAPDDIVALAEHYAA